MEHALDLPLMVLETNKGSMLVEADGMEAGEIYLPGDAAYIVNAVNSHAGLVEALEAVMALAMVKYGNIDPDANRMFDKSAEVIAAAKGEAHE